MNSGPALDFDYMRRRSDTISRSVLLALMLVVGSVQAQTSYFCSMMNTVIHEDCCCDGLEAGDVTVTDTKPCCDKSVGLVIETATDQAQPTTKPIKFGSDVDPPDPLISIFEYSLQPLYTASISGISHTDTTSTANRATYLITQRLRI